MLLTRFSRGLAITIAVTWVHSTNADAKTICPLGPHKTKVAGANIVIDGYEDFPNANTKSGQTSTLHWQFEISDAERSYVICMYTTRTNGVPDTVRIDLPVGTTTCKMKFYEPNTKNAPPTVTDFWCE